MGKMIAAFFKKLIIVAIVVAVACSFTSAFGGTFRRYIKTDDTFHRVVEVVNREKNDFIQDAKNIKNGIKKIMDSI